MKPRGLSIDNINRKYVGTSNLSPVAGVTENRVVIGSPTSQVLRPSTIRTAVSPVAVPAAIPLAQPSAFRRSTVRTVSPIAYPSLQPTVALSTLAPAVQTTTSAIRRSRLVSVVPGHQEVVETIQEQEPTIIKKVVTVVEKTTPGTITETHAGGNMVGVQDYKPRPIPVPATAVRSSCACPWWLWLLLGLLLAGLLAALALNYFRGSGKPATETGDLNKTGESAERQSVEKDSGSSVEEEVSKVEVHPQNCSPGFFFYNKECIKCPSNSGWNRTHCVVRKINTVTTKRFEEVGMVPPESFGSSLTASSLSKDASLFGASASSVSVKSSSASASFSSSSSSTLTIGEYMRKLGLDYETQRKKWEREGSSGEVQGPFGAENSLIVAPIREKRVHEMETAARHHLRKERHD